MHKVHCLLALLSLLVFGACTQQTLDVQPVKTMDEEQFELQVFDNSETFSRLVDVNDHGAVIGVREVSEQEGTLFSQVFFYHDGQKSVDLEKIENFSNIEIQALSNNDLAVGFASRSLGHADGSLRAIVWDCHQNQVSMLDPLPDDEACHAQDISTDGTVISGYSTGSNPARLRPCVWRWEPPAEASNESSSGKWVVTELSSIEKLNPYLMSASAVVSPDGKRVAACITEEFLPNGLVDSSLYMWEFDGESWERRQVSKEQMRLHSMNRHGMIVGDFSTANGKLPCSISSEGELTQLELLPGDVGGEAWDIDDEGLIVGLSDDPHGPEGGPQACVWRDGKASLLAMPEGSMYGIAFGINAKGQIAGLTDVVFQDQTVEDPETGESEPVVKSLGFLWTPAPAATVPQSR